MADQKGVVRETIVREYTPEAPGKVPVRTHIRKGVGKISKAGFGLVKKAIRPRKVKEEDLSPEIRELGTDADDLADLLTKIHKDKWEDK